MRNFIYSSLFLGVTIFLIVVLQAFMPKNQEMVFFFAFVMLADGLLWLTIAKGVSSLRIVNRVLVTTLFWLPVTLLLCMILISYYVPFISWNIPLRTYLQNTLLITFLSLLFPIVAMMVSGIFWILWILFRSNRTFESSKSLLKKIRQFIMNTGWVAGGILFLMMWSGTLFWQYSFKVKEQVIFLDELPPSFDNLRIVQLSDIHLGSWNSASQLKTAIEKVNATRPDIVFFTGDMFNYCTADGYDYREILKLLRAQMGVYAIMGNHDYGDYISWPSPQAKQQNLNDVVNFYNYLGWNLMRNSHTILHRGNDSIALIGLENWGVSRRFQRFGDIAKAIKSVEHVQVQVLLSHDPSYWELVISTRYPSVDLTLSGHTHGGQVGIDIAGLRWSPISWYSKYWSGLYKNPIPGTSQFLYVNQGLGNIGYSGRIGILPEITLIILKRTPGKL